MKISRKQFLWLGGAGSLALLGIPLGAYLRQIVLDGQVSPESRRKLQEFFQNHPGARKIGAAFAAQHGEELSEGRIARLIIEKLEMPAAGAQPAAFEQALLAAQKRDWDRSEPQYVASWMLTEIEVLLCRLAAQLG